MIILLMAFANDEYGFMDVAFVFMLCGFIGSLWILKVLTPSNSHFKTPGLNGIEGEGEEVSSND